MEVYIPEYKRKEVERACQGMIEAVRDIEQHTVGGRDSRVHDEEYGRVVCQADNAQQSWKCRGRFVYGIDSSKTKALYIGYVPEHVGSKIVEDDYDSLKSEARSVTDDQFKPEDRITSAELEAEKQAREDSKRLQKEKKTFRLDSLRQQFEDWNSTGAGEKEILEVFKGAVKESLRAHGGLSKKEQTRIRSLPRDDPFRQTMDTLLPIVEQELIEENRLFPAKNVDPGQHISFVSGLSASARGNQEARQEISQSRGLLDQARTGENQEQETDAVKKDVFVSKDSGRE